MKLEEILQAWEKDAVIDRTKIDAELAKVPKLHHKYYSWFSIERLRLRQLESELRQMRLKKYEHYTQGASEDTKHWKLPPRGMVIKSDAPMYLDADDDINNQQLKIDYAREKVEALQSIVKEQINNRGFLLTGMLNFAKWTGGG